jgi:hypothetical protein
MTSAHRCGSVLRTAVRVLSSLMTAALARAGAIRAFRKGLLSQEIPYEIVKVCIR